MKHPTTPLVLGLVGLITAIPGIQAFSPTNSTNMDPYVECFPSGETLTDWKANYHTYRACHGYDDNDGRGRVAGAFQGTFQPSETKKACIDTTGNVRYEMSVTMLNNRPMDLDDNLCSDRFQRIVKDCWTHHGGIWENVDEGWSLYLDPNSGTC